MSDRIETVYRPSAYTETQTETQTRDRREKPRKREKKDLREQNAILADHVTVEIAEPSQGSRMKASRLLTRQRLWQLKHPEKRRAHEAVRQALLKGTLVKQPCAECGATAHVDAHHPRGYDPDHWLDVEFLCRRHHAARHRRPILIKGPNK